MIYIFKLGYPAIVFTEEFCERSFARADITRHSDMLRFLCFCHYCRVLSRFIFSINPDPCEAIKNLRYQFFPVFNLFAGVF
jgi:hypothetical protein